MAISTFFDHFTALDSSRWGTITGGSGSVTQSGSKVTITTPGTTDAAAIYLKENIDITASQMIAVCLNWHTTVGGPCIFMIDKSGAPIAESQANFFARGLWMNSSSVAASVGALFFKWDNAAALTHWDTATAAWTTGSNHWSIRDLSAGDSFIVVFENDGPNSRWRLHGYVLKSSAWGDAKTQGLVQVALTDWVNWSATRTVSNDVWLVIGDPINSTQATGIDVEWVRTGAEAVEYFALNGKDDGGSYSIKSFRSYDGKFLLPEDRSSNMLSGNVKDPCLVDGGSGTYYLFYRDIANTSVRVATGSSPNGSFTYDTTLISDGSTSFHFPFVVYTPFEGSGYEWQCLVEEIDTSSGIRIEFRLLTASDPSGTWTDHGIVLSYGSGTDKDAHGLISPFIQHRNAVYEVFYSGFYDSGVAMNGTETTVSGMRATGAGLTSAGGGLLALVKDGAGARLPYSNDSEALTANLSGRTASVASTSGFEVEDMPVFFDQDTTDNNWALGRIRTYTANTSLTLYSTITGLTTASGATVFSPLCGPQNIRSIQQRANGDWYVFVTVCQMTKFDTTIGAVFAEFTFLLIVPAGTDLLDMDTSMYSWIDCPSPYLNTFGFGHSAENLSLVYGALTQSTSGNLLGRLMAEGLFVGSEYHA